MISMQNIIFRPSPSTMTHLETKCGGEYVGFFLIDYE